MELTKQRCSAAPAEEGRLAAFLAHEINNPLDSFLSLLYLLKAESTLTFYRPLFEARGITVNARFCSDGHLPVYAGPLRQVFSTLLLNAADAMPKGGRLEAMASAVREWSGQQRYGLRVTFADNGCGIAADNLRKIFEPFFTTKGSGGSGLGPPGQRHSAEARWLAPRPKQHEIGPKR